VVAIAFVMELSSSMEVMISEFIELPSSFFSQVGQLRQRFYHSIEPGGLAADRRGVVPASGFCLSALQIWKVIRENKDLNLPAHKVIVPFFAINSTKLNTYNCTYGHTSICF